MSSPELLVIKKEQAANKNLAFCEGNNTNIKRNCDGETECVCDAFAIGTKNGVHNDFAHRGSQTSSNPK